MLVTRIQGIVADRSDVGGGGIHGLSGAPADAWPWAFGKNLEVHWQFAMQINSIPLFSPAVPPSFIKL